MKVLWFDTETTGLNAVVNDVIQLSGVIEVDGENKESFDIRCQPHNYENISQEALDVHGISIEELKGYQSPKKAHAEFLDILGKYVSKFDRDDKFWPGGYNVKFDLDFVAEWFKKCGDRYFGSWQNWRALDPLPMVNLLAYSGKLPPLPNHKLETICGHFKIEIKAHDALSDVEATVKLFHIIRKELGLSE